MSLKWRSLFFSQDGQPTDLVFPEVVFAKQELCSARSAGMVMGEEVGSGRADARCMLINAVFLLQNRSLLICCHDNANKHLALTTLLFFLAATTQELKILRWKSIWKVTRSPFCLQVKLCPNWLRLPGEVFRSKRSVRFQSLPKAPHTGP